MAAVDGASDHYNWVVPADLPTDNMDAIAGRDRVSPEPGQLPSQ
ncbi:hypothetical protein ACGFXB_24880 [Streptomyces canus]